ncbi:DUF805 domain-containing protein [Brevundimonas sp.]|uniref:DUF805 domain-containing protein n=1 Tax=Brevundimonas sp. TaxID=1871086 RepID=UPI002737C581|nr:DUF805 domain-containing protein [Brevundimonas sp.]MDP3801334.1 DUF805 domain-containing protein [Brevundimonas sp.]
MRGEILDFNDASGEGLISGDDGLRYPFDRTGLMQRDLLRPGQRVDFVISDSVATGVCLLRTEPPPSSARVDGDTLSPWRYFTRCLAKYADGHGRARRREYWYFLLFQALILAVPLIVCIGLAATASSGTPSDAASLTIGLFALLAGVVYLFFVIPGICVSIRRFHDVGLTGWLILLGLIPYVGGLITFVITLLPSEARTNKHGPVPGQSSRTTADVFS